MLNYTKNDKDDGASNNDTALTILVGASAALGAVGFLFAYACLRAWVLAKLWAWYLVPAFGAPILILPVAFGISVITGLLLAPVRQEKTELKTMWLSLVAPIGFLFVGWLGTFFM